MMLAEAKTGNKICGKTKKIFCRGASTPLPCSNVHRQQKNKDKIELYSVFTLWGVRWIP